MRSAMSLAMKFLPSRYARKRFPISSHCLDIDPMTSCLCSRLNFDTERKTMQILLNWRDSVTFRVLRDWKVL
jgi:hypothetical protein